MFNSFKRIDIANVSAGVAVKVVIMTSQFLSIPIYISSIGLDKYGEWLVLTAIPSYLLLSDLGLPITITNSICNLNSQKRFKESDRLFKSSNTLLFILGCLVAFLIFIIFEFTNASEILEIAHFNEQEIRLIVLFYAFNVLASFLFNNNLGQFKVNNRFYKYEMYNCILFLVDFLCVVAVLLLSFQLYCIPVAFFVNRIFFLAICTIDLKNYKHYSYGYSLDLRPAVQILPTSLNYFSFNLGYALFLQGNTIVIGMLLGSVAVVTFNTVRTVVNAIKSFASAVYQPSVQQYIPLLIDGNRKAALDKFKSVLAFSLASSILFALFISFFDNFIFTVWLGKKLAYPKLFLYLMLLSIVLQILWNASSAVLIGVNRTKMLMLFPFLGTVVLIFQFLYLTRFGLVFSSLTLVLADAAMLIFIYARARSIILNPAILTWR